jgi:N-acetylgalactosamine-N,N'-diacetylbacillosaminyl-diphospho-undecaprenol 4-alpha-N-acetylgalactosaminyltransferase
MRPKISFIINSLAGGGAERVMTTLLSHSQARLATHDFELVLLDGEPDAYALPDWLPVVRLGGGGGLGASLKSLSAHLLRRRPDVTLSFLTRANICNAVAMRVLRRPFIISERVHTSAHLGNGRAARVIKALVRLTYPRAFRVIAVSRGVGDHLVECYGTRADRVVSIDNPFDLARIAGLAAEPAAWRPDAPYLLGVGRLAPNKNFALLLRAYAAARPEQHLVIAGEGAERESLLALARELDVADRVHLPGFTANPYALMAGADYYVLPSNAEGFPNGLVEAMAVGLPVLSTDCPSGPSEILGARAKEGLTIAPDGLLVPCDDVAAMAAGMRHMADPAERDRLGKRAASRAADFDVSAVAGRYWAIIDDALRAAAK